MDELKERLKNVSDCYDDFVGGVIAAVRDGEKTAEEVLSYLNENPNAETSDVLDFIFDMLE